MDYCCISSRRDTRDKGEKEMNEERKKEKVNYTIVLNCVHLVLDNEFTLWGLRAQE